MSETDTRLDVADSWPVFAEVPLNAHEGSFQDLIEGVLAAPTGAVSKTEAPHTGPYLGTSGKVIVQRPIQDEASFLHTETLQTTGRVETGDEAGALPRTRTVLVPQAEVLGSEPEQRYILLRKFEGVVTKVSEDSFWARLTENAGDYPTVEAEFDVAEISETDRKLLVPGAPLVWTMGYRYEGSTRKRESMIYLRRLPPWSAEELKTSLGQTESLMREIEWE